jgi:hypothetical protein
MSDFTSLTTRLHLLGSTGSYAAFLVAGFACPRLFAGRSEWAWASKPSLLLVLLSIATGFLRLSDVTPGVGQRITFALVFLWIALVAYCLLVSTRRVRNKPSDA